MFHRKVYPENTIYSKKITTSHKGKIENPPRDCFNENDNGDTTNPDHGRRFHSDSKSREWSQYCKTNWNPPQHGPSYGGSTGNNEHWIKTDAECKYYVPLQCNSSVFTHTNLINIIHLYHHFKYSLFFFQQHKIYSINWVIDGIIECQLNDTGLWRKYLREGKRKKRVGKSAGPMLLMEGTGEFGGHTKTTKYILKLKILGCNTLTCKWWARALENCLKVWRPGSNSLRFSISLHLR